MRSQQQYAGCVALGLATVTSEIEADACWSAAAAKLASAGRKGHAANALRATVNAGTWPATCGVADLVNRPSAVVALLLCSCVSVSAPRQSSTPLLPPFQHWVHASLHLTSHRSTLTSPFASAHPHAGPPARPGGALIHSKPVSAKPVSLSSPNPPATANTTTTLPRLPRPRPRPPTRCPPTHSSRIVLPNTTRRIGCPSTIEPLRLEPAPYKSPGLPISHLSPRDSVHLRSRLLTTPQWPRIHHHHPRRPSSQRCRILSSG